MDSHQPTSLGLTSWKFGWGCVFLGSNRFSWVIFHLHSKRKPQTAFCECDFSSHCTEDAMRSKASVLRVCSRGFYSCYWKQSREDRRRVSVPSVSALDINNCTDLTTDWQSLCLAILVSFKERNYRENNVMCSRGIRCWLMKLRSLLQLTQSSWSRAEFCCFMNTYHQTLFSCVPGCFSHVESDVNWEPDYWSRDNLLCILLLIRNAFRDSQNSVWNGLLSYP